MGLSQRALGQMFTPPVTTQFISNLERGVTPLPPNHVPTLTQALRIEESELMSLLEKEYAAKLSGRLGRPAADAAGNGGDGASAQHTLAVASEHYNFMRNLYDAFRIADKNKREEFAGVCESLLRIPRPPGSAEGTGE